MQLEQVCAAVWKGYVMGLRNIQGTTNRYFFFKKTCKLFMTKEAIGKGESLSYNTERRKGLGRAGMQSFPLTGNATIRGKKKIDFPF